MLNYTIPLIPFFSTTGNTGGYSTIDSGSTLNNDLQGITTDLGSTLNNHQDITTDLGSTLNNHQDITTESSLTLDNHQNDDKTESGPTVNDDNNNSYQAVASSPEIHWSWLGFAVGVLVTGVIFGLVLVYVVMRTKRLEQKHRHRIHADHAEYVNLTTKA